MLKRDDAIKGIDVEVELSEQERGILTAVIKQDGFNILQRLMEDQVRKFNLKLINTPASDNEAVLANHSLAKAVAQFYVGFMRRIEQECEIQRSVDADPAPENNMNMEELR